MLKTIGIALIVALAMIGGGWLWGASGRSEAEQAQRAAELRADVAESRALLLEARVHLYTVNFGSAGRALDDARARITAMQTRLREAGQASAQDSSKSSWLTSVTRAGSRSRSTPARRTPPRARSTP